MGLFIKLLLLLVVVALAAPFVLKGPDDQPLMTLDDIQKPGALSKLTESIPEAIKPFQGEGDKKGQPAIPKTGKQKLYSWTDEQGNVHYSNIAPTGPATVKTIQVDPNINVIKMDKPEEGQPGVLPVQEDQGDKDSGLGKVSVYTPEGTQKLIDDARAVEDKMREHERVIDQQ